jgi:tetratricopeptide (TPR) repeat protein
LAGEGRFEESFAHFEESIREDPNSAHRVKPDYADAVAGYGEELLANGETEKAREQFERALAIWPRSARAKEQLESVSGSRE